MNVQTLYQQALSFSALRHGSSGAKVTGTKLPYIVHVVDVAMEVLVAAPHSEEFDLGFAVQAALLHDTVEDTGTTLQEIEQEFGKEIAAAVDALSKNEALPKDDQIKDSVQRIKQLQKEVWAVKLADRITNLMPPPKKWGKEKIQHYLEDSKMIWKELKNGNSYLAQRLEEKIQEYHQYL